MSSPWYLPELPQQLMAAAPPALGTLLFAQEFNGHVEVLHSLQPELRGGCLHLALQLLSTHHGSQHVQNLHTHRAKASTTLHCRNIYGLSVCFATPHVVLNNVLLDYLKLSAILMFVAWLISMSY